MGFCKKFFTRRLANFSAHGLDDSPIAFLFQGNFDGMEPTFNFRGILFPVHKCEN